MEQARVLKTEIPGPRSRALWERRTRAVPAAVGTTLPVFVADAHGAIVEDVDGNRFIDVGAGIAVVNVGHAHPAVVAAIRDQTERFLHTCFQVTPYENYVAVCEALNRLTPGAHEKRSLLVNSGAEAVENAVKIARAVTGRPAIVAFDQAFHGRTLLTLSLTAKVSPYKQSFGPYAPEIYRAPYSYPFRGTGGLDECIAWIEANVDPADVAAVVVEPIAGEGGFVVPRAGWVAGMRAWCRAQRRPADRRRGADGIRPYGRVVRVRARRRRARHRRDREGPRRRHTDRRCDGAGRAHGRGASRWAGRHVRRQPRVAARPRWPRST